MNVDCRSFRRRLAAVLRSRPSAGRLMELSWSLHLLTCSACRRLLEDEEALEMVLASLPEPRLPRDLAERVVARLRGAPQTVAGSLERMLELEAEVAVPSGLSSRVLGSLTAVRREAALDVLLEEQPFVPVPAGLADRVLTGLAPARHAPLRRLAGRGLRRAAAVLAVGLGATLVARLGSGGPPTLEHGDTQWQAAQGDPDPQLLKNLTLLENWDQLLEKDLDVLLSSTVDGEETAREAPKETPEKPLAPPPLKPGERPVTQEEKTRG